MQLVWVNTGNKITPLNDSEWFCCPSEYTEYETTAHACVSKAATNVERVTINTFSSSSNNNSGDLLHQQQFVSLFVASFKE